MQLILIRHAATQGNLQRRYIGSTDEPLCPEGVEQLRARMALGDYPPAEQVVASPMQRALETAGYLYPGVPLHLEADLRECSFGPFENKNYDQLRDIPLYRAWIDSRGMLPLPGGEGRDAFSARCRAAAGRWIDWALKEGVASLAMVTHGGSIMAILEALASEHRDFYSWQPESAGGYLALVSPETFAAKRKIEVLRPLGKKSE